MISLGVELAERGMPLLGLFGLPHAQTDATHRLPAPQSYALLSPHGDYEVLQDQAALYAVVNAFQWGNERSVLLIDGLDRLANAFGDNGMVDVLRSICDGVRFNDHIALITTDLELFETGIQRSIASEATNSQDFEANTLALQISATGISASFTCQQIEFSQASSASIRADISAILWRIT